jgi:hypothetical protein
MPNKLKSKLKTAEFYCVKCRKRRSGQDIKLVSIKNKKVGKIPALKSKCSKCSTNMTKFVRRDAVESLKKKF